MFPFYRLNVNVHNTYVLSKLGPIFPSGYENKRKDQNICSLLPYELNQPHFDSQPFTTLGQEPEVLVLNAVGAPKVSVLDMQGFPC